MPCGVVCPTAGTQADQLPHACGLLRVLCCSWHWLLNSCVAGCASALMPRAAPAEAGQLVTPGTAASSRRRVLQARRGAGASPAAPATVQERVDSVHGQSLFGNHIMFLRPHARCCPYASQGSVRCGCSTPQLVEARLLADAAVWPPTRAAVQSLHHAGLSDVTYWVLAGWCCAGRVDLCELVGYGVPLPWPVTLCLSASQADIRFHASFPVVECHSCGGICSPTCPAFLVCDTQHTLHSASEHNQ